MDFGWPIAILTAIAPFLLFGFFELTVNRNRRAEKRLGQRKKRVSSRKPSF